MTSITRKMCMIGDFGVGKTSLIRRFVERQFSDQYLSTVGVKISRKTVTLPAEEAEIKLLIWDIEGQTKFKGIAPSYLQGASGVLIVCDATRKETIEHLKDHVKLYYSVNPKGTAIIGINKVDLLEPKDLEILRSIANENIDQVIGIFGTSAKTGENVDLIFETLCQKILVDH